MKTKDVDLRELFLAHLFLTLFIAHLTPYCHGVPYLTRRWVHIRVQHI